MLQSFIQGQALMNMLICDPQWCVSAPPLFSSVSPRLCGLFAGLTAVVTLLNEWHAGNGHW